MLDRERMFILGSFLFPLAVGLVAATVPNF